MNRAACFCILFLITGCGGGGGGSSSTQPPPNPPFVSAPDCVTPANLVAEAADAPKNATFMRVQHIGDAGTPELAGEVANVVTWPVGDYTGFYPPDAAANGSQRGFRNVGAPNPSSAFQLSCNAAGFFINTAQFSHTLPLVGEGPSASIARELLPEVQPFRDASSVLSIQANATVRTFQAQRTDSLEVGVAQLSFFYYARDVTTGTVIAHLVQLYDNRPAGSASGVGTESVGSDGQVAFVESPLARTNDLGMPVNYVNVGAGSETLQVNQTWLAPRFFRAEIPHAKFLALLARLRAGPLPSISPRPEDYRITLFGVLGEVFVGTGDQHNVMFGVSVSDLRVAGG